MGKVIVEKNYKRFQPVAQDEDCKDCPSGCQLSCQRIMQENVMDLEKDVELSIEKHKAEFHKYSKS